MASDGYWGGGVCELCSLFAIFHNDSILVNTYYGTRVTDYRQEMAQKSNLYGGSKMSHSIVT